LWPSLTNMRWRVIHIVEQAQGLTPFVPYHTSPPLCGNTRYTHIHSHPSPHRNTIQYATTCKYGNGATYGHKEGKWGGDTGQGGGPITTTLCSTHQWVHWCTCLTSKHKLLLPITFPLHCMAQVVLYPLTPRNQCQNPQKPILVSTSTGSGFDWYGYGNEEKYLGVTHANNYQYCWQHNCGISIGSVMDMMGHLPDSQFI
jgi:hypothetical protein